MPSEESFSESKNSKCSSSSNLKVKISSGKLPKDSNKAPEPCLSVLFLQEHFSSSKVVNIFWGRKIRKLKEGNRSLKKERCHLEWVGDRSNWAEFGDDVFYFSVKGFLSV